MVYIELNIYNYCTHCIYRALRARSDWVQSTDARISYASAPPLTNCHRSPNSMMFLDSGIKLASHTKTILRILEMCFRWLRKCSSQTQRHRDSMTARLELADTCLHVCGADKRNRFRARATRRSKPQFLSATDIALVDLGDCRYFTAKELTINSVD